MLGRAITVALASSLLLPAGAAAQSNRPDPDSPAGVEYELPLDQTRKDLSGDASDGDRGGGREGSSPEASGGSGGDGAAPLFGAGISREEDSGGPQSSNGDGADPEAEDGSSTEGDASPAVTKASTGEDGSTGLLLPGLALLVILAGAAMGLLLRRGLGSSGS